MNSRELQDAFTGLPIGEVVLEFEKEWSHATAIGEAVWSRICRRNGINPKSSEARVVAMRNSVIDVVRGAAFVIERDGIEGVERWLAEEESYV